MHLKRKGTLLEKTLFTLEWLQSVELRRRVQVGLNKGEARYALARAVFFYRHGRVQDRSHAQQQRRAQGLNLVVAAIILWNTLELGAYQPDGRLRLGFDGEKSARTAGLAYTFPGCLSILEAWRTLFRFRYADPEISMAFPH